MQIICHSFHSLPIPSVLTVSLREYVCCPPEGVQSEASQAVSVSLFTLAAGFVWVFCGGPKKSSVRSAPRGKHAQLALLSPPPSLHLSLTFCVFPSHAPLSFWQLSVPGENLLCFRFNLFYCEMHFRLQLRLRLRLVSFFLRFFSALILLAPKNRSQNELIRKCRVDFRPERNENKFNLSVSYAFHDTDSVAVGARWWRREGKEEEAPWLEAAVFVVAVVALVTI